MTKSEQWILSEWLTAKDRALKYNEKLLKHRWRTPFAEVDLVFENQNPRYRGITIVEVKTESSLALERELLGRKQMMRLMGARAYIEDHFERPTRILLAVCEKDMKSVRYFPLT